MLVLFFVLALAQESAQTSVQAPEPDSASDTLAALTPLFSTTVLLAVAVDYVELECGHVGDSVPIVRDALSSAGYTSGVGSSDTLYSSNLAAAVKRFQRDEGIDRTGVVDQQTLVQLALAGVDPDSGLGTGREEGEPLEAYIMRLLAEMVERKEEELPSRLDDEPCSEGKSARE